MLVKTLSYQTLKIDQLV